MDQGAGGAASSTTLIAAALKNSNAFDHRRIKWGPRKPAISIRDGALSVPQKQRFVRL